MPTDKDWIATASGRKFYPLAPRMEDICIEDIAHHLANICRFTGATREHYSVAQHCVIGSIFCEQPLDFLLHDAAEAYLNDMSRPVKHDDDMRPYRVAEVRLQAMIAKRFNLAWPSPACVKMMDDRMCQTERRDLMPPTPEWTLGVEPLHYRIIPWTPREARLRFLDRFDDLTRPGLAWLRSIGLVPRDSFALN